MSRTKELLEDMHYIYDKMLKRIEHAEFEYYYGKTINRNNSNNTEV